MSQNDGAGAIAALETVPGKARNPRINMALGKLYSARGLERSAITAYKEVLRVRFFKRILNLNTESSMYLPLCHNSYTNVVSLF